MSIEAMKQEPVAWMWEKSHYPESRTVELGLLFKKTDSYGDVEWTPLYTSPPAKPWVNPSIKEYEDIMLANLTPRTDDERDGIMGALNDMVGLLKEKNT